MASHNTKIASSMILDWILEHILSSSGIISTTNLGQFSITMYFTVLNPIGWKLNQSENAWKSSTKLVEIRCDSKCDNSLAENWWQLSFEVLEGQSRRSKYETEISFRVYFAQKTLMGHRFDRIKRTCRGMCRTSTKNCRQHWKISPTSKFLSALF